MNIINKTSWYAATNLIVMDPPLVSAMLVYGSPKGNSKNFLCVVDYFYLSAFAVTDKCHSLTSFLGDILNNGSFTYGGVEAI